MLASEDPFAGPRHSRFHLTVEVEAEEPLEMAEVRRRVMASPTRPGRHDCFVEPGADRLEASVRADGGVAVALFLYRHQDGVWFHVAHTPPGSAPRLRVRRPQPGPYRLLVFAASSTPVASTSSAR